VWSVWKVLVSAAVMFIVLALIVLGLALLVSFFVPAGSGSGRKESD
jgi:hypothetical protein